nr:immunoglobulin light chain junction region [Macaca mulatta]
DYYCSSHAGMNTFVF